MTRTYEREVFRRKYKSGVERRWSLVDRDLVIKRYEELSEEVKKKKKLKDGRP